MFIPGYLTGKDSFQTMFIQFCRIEKDSGGLEQLMGFSGMTGERSSCSKRVPTRRITCLLRLFHKFLKISPENFGFAAELKLGCLTPPHSVIDGLK